MPGELRVRPVAADLRRAANLVNRRLAIHAGQRLRLYPVLGFPKSGTTWLCQMLSDALGVPFPRLPLLPVLRPSVLHAHWSYHPRLRGVTFIVRDGRDTMISFYFFYKLMHDAGERTAFRTLYPAGTDLNDVRVNLPRFIGHAFKHPMGVRSSWPEYNRSWLNRPGVAYTRYESLQADPNAELTRLCHELGVAPDPDRVRHAVDRWAMSRVTGRDPGEEDRSSFVRKGVSGEWSSVFSDEARALFADLAGDALVELGYEASADWRTWRGSAPPPAPPDQ
jgi:hypothetical protein